MSRILLDHCVPKPLRRLLSGEDVRTCHEEGWDTLRNGELLIAAESAGFDIFVTADKSLRYQQNLSSRRLAIIELPTNRVSQMAALAQILLQLISTAVAGSYHVIPPP